MTRDIRKVSHSQPDEHLEMGKLSFYMGYGMCDKKECVITRGSTVPHCSCSVIR